MHHLLIKGGGFNPGLLAEVPGGEHTALIFHMREVIFQIAPVVGIKLNPLHTYNIVNVLKYG